MADEEPTEAAPGDDQPTDPASGNDQPADPAGGPDQPTDAASGTGGDSQAPADGTARSPSTGGGLPWVFLLGFLFFVASALAFAADLATGHDVQRSLAVNFLAAVSLVAWAGIDSYTDTDSGVETRAGALGTGLILVGLYLLGAGLVVAASSPLHGRLVIGLAMVALGVPLVLGGFLAFPRERLPVGEDAADPTEAGPAPADPENGGE